jgi:hypothetical protein
MELDADTLVKLVAAAVPASPEPHRTAESLAQEFGVSVQRIQRAIARIKDEYPDLPLTSGERGYRWSRDEVDIKRHARKETKYVSTRTRRSLLDGLLAPYQKANPEQAERTRQRIEFILDDLARLSA